MGVLVGAEVSTIIGAVMMCVVLSEWGLSGFRGVWSSLSESVRLSDLEMVVFDRVDRLLDDNESSFSLFLSSSIMVIARHLCLFVVERANRLCLVVQDGGT